MLYFHKSGVSCGERGKREGCKNHDSITVILTFLSQKLLHSEFHNEPGKQIFTRRGPTQFLLPTVQLLRLHQTTQAIQQKHSSHQSSPTISFCQPCAACTWRLRLAAGTCDSKHCRQARYVKKNGNERLSKTRQTGRLCVNGSYVFWIP